MIAKVNTFIAYAQHYASTEFVLSRDLLSNAGRAVRVAENTQVIKFSKIKAS